MREIEVIEHYKNGQIYEIKANGLGICFRCGLDAKKAKKVGGKCCVPGSCYKTHMWKNRKTNQDLMKTT